VLFPLTFASNVFVEPDTMPGWVQSFVKVNPVTHLVTAVRGLMSGSMPFGDIGLVLAESAVLIAVFGSPPYVEWAQDNADPGTAGGWFLHILTWPSWQFDVDASVRDIMAAILRALLLLLAAGIFLNLLPGSQLARARASVSQFLAGWAAYIFAGAVAGLLAALIQSDPSALGALEAAGDGARYGLFAGWIVGIATLGGRRPA
jgi:hypothetical protein